MLLLRLCYSSRGLLLSCFRWFVVFYFVSGVIMLLNLFCCAVVLGISGGNSEWVSDVK